MPPNYSKNDFESVRSVLTWNLENWSQGRLNRYEDNANYSCRSSANSVGPGVHSATHFRVEYPPDSLFVSQEVVSVLEHDTPERVLCSAQAYPEATYMWRFNDQVVQTHNVLYFGGPVNRDQAGIYVCEAQNRHGTAYVTARLNVMYRPECQISQEKSDDGDSDEGEDGAGGIRLICMAEANPPEVSFQWRRGNGSAAADFDGEAVTLSKGRQQSSVLVLNTGLQQQGGEGNFGTFQCYVNNSLGLGLPCEMDVQGVPVGLVRNMSNTNIIVIVAVIAAGLVAAALVATTVIVCRRWRVPEEKQKKCTNNGEDRDRNENEVSGITGGTGVGVASAGGQPPSQPVHKWPLRPGVHVHVNGLNTLTGGPSGGVPVAAATTNGKLNHQISGFSYGATKSSRSSSSSGSDWASNASSNPELSSTTEMDPLKRQQQQQLVARLSAGKGVGVLATHPELPGDTATASSSASSSSTASTGVEGAKDPTASSGSRPSSRLRKSRREAVQSSDSHHAQPAYYENVSYHPTNKQKQLDLLLLQRRSESPHAATAASEEDSGAGLMRSRHSSGCNLRPASQIGSGAVTGGGSLYGSTRSSRAGSVPRAVAAPSPACGLHPAYRASLGRTTNHRAHGEQPLHHHQHHHHNHPQGGRHRTLHHGGYGGNLNEVEGGPLPLTEAEVETDSDLSQERNLLIEYTTHVPYSAYASHDTPILSSLLHSQSLSKTAALGRYRGPLDYGGGGGGGPSLLLLTEPISPPKQFDTSPRPSGRESTY